MIEASSHFNPLLVPVFVVLLVLFWVVPICALLYLVYVVLTLPLRRRERARLFLYLVEAGLEKGLAPENAIATAVLSGDRTLGGCFYDLAAYIRNGVPLSGALDKVPRLLPPRVSAMLKAGARLGDVLKVLPACQTLLGDGVSHVRGAINYLVLIAFVTTPMTVMIPIVMRIIVFPSFRQIFLGMSDGYQFPAFTKFMFDSGSLMTCIQVSVMLALWIALVLYVGGPRLRNRVLHWLGASRWASPWTWKRRQRDFSAMLAVLLDSGLAEADAVRLAGDSTASPLMREHAERVCAQLSRGVTLPEALRSMDRHGELSWRINNALRHRTGFLKALAGWHESLDAKAFQLEQAAAQVTTSGLVLLNGAIVACVVIGVFMALIRLLNDATLW